LRYGIERKYSKKLLLWWGRLNRKVQRIFSKSGVGVSVGMRKHEITKTTSSVPLKWSPLGKQEKSSKKIFYFALR